MSFPNRDAQILAHILEYCNRVEKTLSRFGRNFDIFLDDQDYMDSVSMNLLQIGELAGKFSDAYVQKTKPQMDWRAIKNMRNMFAHDYGSIKTDEPRTLDFSGVRGFLVTNVCIVQRSAV